MSINHSHINKRVVQVAESTLYHQHYVSSVDILMGIGYLQPVHLQDWRKGKIPYLESVIQANLDKISFAMECFRAWARQKGLKPSQTAYLARTEVRRKTCILAKVVIQKLRKLTEHITFPLYLTRKNKKNSRRS